jgi:ubiquinone/menaquinone biosynthesis C-methylase UbiE
MPNLFDDFAMAEGYAGARPPVHPRVIERLPIQHSVNLALDLGCGAGLSTAALAPLARHRLGFDPSEAMVKAARRRVPGAAFFVASAEEIPIASRQVDLIAAAGSLNYADLARFFPEASRILNTNGVLVVYDFSPGRSFTNQDSLTDWFNVFSQRYPWPAFNGHPLNPEILSRLDSGFTLRAHENFVIPIPLTHSAYLNYMMTETNVAEAISNGTPSDEIRAWCAATLAPIFGEQPREVLFHGYFACLTVSAQGVPGWVAQPFSPA